MKKKPEKSEEGEEEKKTLYFIFLGEGTKAHNLNGFSIFHSDFWFWKCLSSVDNIEYSVEKNWRKLFTTFCYSITGSYYCGYKIWILFLFPSSYSLRTSRAKSDSQLEKLKCIKKKTFGWFQNVFSWQVGVLDLLFLSFYKVGYIGFSPDKSWNEKTFRFI